VPSRFPFRLAAIDLDGTLLGADHRPTHQNAEAVRRLAEEGVLCVVASGRMHESSAPFARELGLDSPVISYNGALVRSGPDGETWHHLPVPADVADEVIDYCAEHGMHLNFYVGDRVLVAAQTPWGDLYLRHTASPMEAVGDLRRYRGQEPTKMILIDSPERTDELLPVFRARFFERAYVTKSNPEYLEFMNRDANKGRALSHVAKRLGVARKDVVAFGDSDNDIPMLEWAGLGVAVGRPSAKVRAAANIVVDCPDGNALASAIATIRSSTVGRG